MTFVKIFSPSPLVVAAIKEITNDAKNANNAFFIFKYLPFTLNELISLGINCSNIIELNKFTCPFFLLAYTSNLRDFKALSSLIITYIIYFNAQFMKNTRYRQGIYMLQCLDIKYFYFLAFFLAFIYYMKIICCIKIGNPSHLQVPS